MKQFALDQVVRVEIGDDLANSPKGPRRWVLGTVEQIGVRSGEFGNIISVNIHPEREGVANIVRRYEQASRIEAGSLEQAHELAHARRMLSLQQDREAASLATQPPVKDASKPKAATVNIKLTKPMQPETVAAVLGHKDIVLAVNTMLSELSNKLATVTEVNLALRRDLAGTSQSLETTRTALESCDHERRTLLKEKSTRRQVTPSEIFASAGKQRGFILWCPTSQQPPRVVYKTYTEAKSVQEQMATRHTGQLFYILAIGDGLKITTKTTTTREVA